MPDNARSTIAKSSRLLDRLLPWFLAIFMPFLLVALAVVHFSVRQLRGEFPADGDSISIPIGTSILLAVALLPILLGVTWLCVRTASGRRRLLAWNDDRPVLSIAATIVFGTLAFFASVYAAIDVVRAESWVDPVGAIILLLLAWWLLLLRSALLSPNHGSEREAALDESRQP